jgi:DNA-binding transcriptional regulator/RsmH inhibitor MraZ
MQHFTPENDAMFAVEIDATIDPAGNIHLPERYRQLYGKAARLVVLLPEEDSAASTVARLSEKSLEKVWNNQDDEVYDPL